MNNAKLFLLIGTSLSFIPHLTSAQCVATQDCATLGYTETSCSGGSGVKCPFGNKWACFKSDSEVCQQYGFTQTCTGAGQLGKGESCANLYKQCDCQDTYKYVCSGTEYSGGSGSACGGKYAECTCASGYKWDATSGTCKANTANCVIGALYYSDGTCSNDYISSKKLLGIVIYEKSASQNGWIMTHKPVATNIQWSPKPVDISGVLTTSSESKLTDIQASCTNTDIITAQGNSIKYPAAWAAKNYKEGGKTWCLPSGGLLKNALDNSANLAKFNAAILEIQSEAGTSAATILGNVSGGYENVWSSSEYSYLNVWDFYADTSGSFYMGYNYKTDDYYSTYSVRPVMAF